MEPIIFFVDVSKRYPRRKTKVFEIRDFKNQADLGKIEYSSGHKGYVWKHNEHGINTYTNVVRSYQVIKDIYDVMTDIMKKKGVKTMPDRDGKGPRKRSPRPSKRKGGRKKGGC